uniref:Type I interferon 35 n=1 Tax=Xenopus tropicalis TaxID=8364 RepID=A0A1B1FFS4_XENTR|nr:type I interferon 35 [Xenopus tropicalis]
MLMKNDCLAPEEKHECFPRLPRISWAFDTYQVEAAVGAAIQFLRETFRFYNENFEALGLSQELGHELLQLLDRLIEEWAPYVTDTTVNEDVSQGISEFYRQLINLVRKEGNAACVLSVISENLYQVAHLLSRVQKHLLVNDTSREEHDTTILSLPHVASTPTRKLPIGTMHWRLSIGRYNIPSRALTLAPNKALTRILQ